MNVVTQFPVKDTWLAQCISENGKPLPIVTNALVALRRDPDIRDAFAYDQMQRCVMLVHEIGQPMASFDCRSVTDEDITVATEFLQKAGIRRIARDTVRDAVNVRARERSYHPIGEWLDGLVWDGQKRTNVWMTTRLGAELNSYTQAMGRCF
jgi:predicted P-loop ATPase